MPQTNEYLDIEQSFFAWPKADEGYYWDDQAMVSRPINAIHMPPFLVASPESTGLIATTPLEKEPSLFLAFAELSEEPDAILAFANQYGHLTQGVRIDIKPPMPADKGKPVFYPLEGESLHFWQREIRQMALAVQLWRWLEDKNVEALKKIIRWDGVEFGGSVEVLVKYRLGGVENLLASENYNNVIFKRFRPGELILPAKCLLQNIINVKLKRYPANPRLLLNEANELAPYIYPESLLSAMWLQFLRAVTGERKFRQCKVCLKWEDATGRNKNWQAHPECANRERVRRAREKAKIGRPTGSKVVDGFEK